MKIRSFILFILSLGFFASQAQIPNYSFENWTNSMPDDWNTNSSPPLLMPVSQSTDAHTGFYAIHGQVVNDSGVVFAPFIDPVTSHFGFPVSQNYDTLFGWFKSNMIAADLGSVEVYAYDSFGVVVGSGIFYFGSSANYDQFAIPILYTPGLLATEMSIIIQILDTTPGSLYHVGSSFVMDDLTFQAITTDIKTPSNNHLTISPNPASTFIKISAGFPAENIFDLKIYDSIGKIVYQKSFYNEGFDFASIDVSQFPIGFYLLVASDDKNKFTQKIILSR